MGWMTRGIGALWPSRAAGGSTFLPGASPQMEFFFTGLAAAGREAGCPTLAGAPPKLLLLGWDSSVGCSNPASFAWVGFFAVFFAAVALFASALAIESASQSFFFEPPVAETLRLLFHSAEPASPAISSMDRLVSTE